MLRFLTAGESHGRYLIGILEGMPAGLQIDEDRINLELKRRQSGYGRSQRMEIEKDRVRILSGLKNKLTLGSPITLLVDNKEFKIESLPAIVSPRPGHADLAGAIKYGFFDIRNVLERASARETAIRVAVGAVCKIFLDGFGIKINSKVLTIGGTKDKDMMNKRIDLAIKKKDTVGGTFEVIASGLPAGLGSYVHYDRRLDARLALSLISIPGIKAVEFGLGFGYADKFGSQVHDAIYYSKGKRFYRKTNNAGGIEGGVSNGEPIVIRCCMKPIATLANPLSSVDIITKRPVKAAVERADTCVLEAAGVIAEGMVAFELSYVFIEKFGGDSLKEIKRNYQLYLKAIT